MDKLKKITWNTANVAFFWKTYLRDSNKFQVWMSEGSGKAIERRMKKMLPNSFFSAPKRICDWGCGKGVFGKKLALHKHMVYGFDQTQVVASISNEVINFKAIDKSSLIKNHELDLVYAIEVLEHIIDDELYQTFTEWKRILNKEGYLLLTTPNDENLDDNSIVCPNCERSFHTVQHVRSLNTDSISSLLKENGFDVKKIWLGEFFFATNRGSVLELIRKLKFLIRQVVVTKRNNYKHPHMMVLATPKQDKSSIK